MWPTVITSGNVSPRSKTHPSATQNLGLQLCSQTQPPPPPPFICIRHPTAIRDFALFIIIDYFYKTWLIFSILLYLLLILYLPLSLHCEKLIAFIKNKKDRFYIAHSNCRIYIICFVSWNNLKTTNNIRIVILFLKK